MADRPATDSEPLRSLHVRLLPAPSPFSPLTYACEDCGAIVHNPALHHDWHTETTRG